MARENVFSEFIVATVMVSNPKRRLQQRQRNHWHCSKSPSHFVSEKRYSVRWFIQANNQKGGWFCSHFNDPYCRKRNNKDNNDDLGQVYKTIRRGNAFYLHNFQLVLCVCLRMRILHVIFDHGKVFGVLRKNLKKGQKIQVFFLIVSRKQNVSKSS